MSARLSVVATPIGNLADLSPRATEALRGAEVVFAEDTRHTRPLLERVGAKARLVSCHQHNEEERVAVVAELLDRGAACALVSDAGAPGVSDPGARLVDALVRRGYEIEVVPGPSAVVAALMGAGLVAHRFAFLGFLPRRRRARARIVEDAARGGLALVVFEAPTRVADTLADLAEILGPRRVVVARELTKRFETFHRGVLGQALSPPLEEKGEIVIVVEASVETEHGEDARGAPEDEASLVARLQREGARTPKERVKELAAKSGLSRKDAYRLLFLDGERGPRAPNPGGEGE